MLYDLGPEFVDGLGVVVWVVGNHSYSSVSAPEILEGGCFVHIGRRSEVCDVLQGYFLHLLSVVDHVQNAGEVFHVQVCYSSDVHTESQWAFVVEATSVLIDPLPDFSLVDLQQGNVNGYAPAVVAQADVPGVSSAFS